MRRCHYCGKILHELPFTCRRCGHIFCSDHHLPENHNCHGHRYPSKKKPQHRYCGNCGRELTGMPYKCHRCGLILCADCRLPENHGCEVKPVPPPPRPLKSYINMRPVVNASRQMRAAITLKNFTIFSFVLMGIGFLLFLFPLDNHMDLFFSFFFIGGLCFLCAYFLYAVKCWGSDGQICAMLMLTLPLLVHFSATSAIPESTGNILFYLIMQFCFSAIISAVILYVSEKIINGISRHLFRRGMRYSYFSPDLLSAVVGVVLVSGLVIIMGSPALFSENLNLVSKSITTSSDSKQTIQTSPALQPDSHANPAVTTTTNQPFRIETTIPPNYETGATTRTFDYVLRGQKGSISTTLYSGIYTQQKSGSKPATCSRYNYDASPCTQEEIRLYYLKILDEPIQKKGLDDLVRKIKLQTSNQDDQARIAISLVQNIPYDYSQLYSLNSDMSYPYGVLYQNTGVCSEKSVLLAYLLRELGYGVVLFEFNSENHMAVGIQSPSQYSYRNSGYAFIEATTPSIVTDSEGDYVGAGKLSSVPKIMKVSDGSSFSSISEEYYDAITMNQFGNSGGTLSPEKYRQWEILVWKYGIITHDGTTVWEDPSDKPLCDGGMLCNGECYTACGSYSIARCTSNGVICEADPNNCPPGQIACNSQCWLMCYGASWQCTSQGLVCYY